MALTRFTFECDGVTITGEGVVTIQGAPPDDGGISAILAFLDGIDAEGIEKEAFQRQGYGNECTTAHVIAILREQLTGTYTPP